MWSLPKLALLFAAVASAVPLASNSGESSDTSIAASASHAEINGRDVANGSHELEARIPDRGRMQLQYSLQGRIVFLCGMIFPQEIIDAFAVRGDEGPAQQILQEFKTYLDGPLNPFAPDEKAFVAEMVKDGGLYGKAGEAIQGTFGVAFQLKPGKENALQTWVEVVKAWATRDGGVVETIQRPNGFIDLERIGAGGAKRNLQLASRSRSTQCAANMNILQYVKEDVPAVDLTKDVRWAGTCDA